MNKFSIINKSLKKIYLHIFDRNLCLLCIFILALTLRIVGVYPGYFSYPDEPKISDAAMNIVLSFNFDPVAFYYGSLLPIIYAFIDFLILPFYILFYLTINASASIAKNDLGFFDCFSKRDFSFCVGIDSSNFFLYITRYETALLSSITVILVYYLGKRLFNKNVGLLAALFTAVNYRHILSSHFALADAPLAVFILLSVLFCLRLLKKPSLYSYIIAGFSLGLTFSIKYFTYTLFTLLLCHFLSKRVKSNLLIKIWESLIDYKIYVSLIVGALTFSLINPYIFIDPQSFKEQYELNSMFYGVSGISFNTFFSLQKIPLFSLYYLINFGLGIFLTIATVMGLVLSILKYRFQTYILLSVIIPFFYVFLIISGNTYVRNYSAILPLVTIFPAVFIYEFYRILFKSNYISKMFSKFIIVVICSILIYSPLKNSIILSFSFSQTNNYKLLENWILDVLPDNAKLAKTSFTPFPGRKLVDLADWTPYSSDYKSLSELISSKTQWLIISSDSGVYINHFLNISYGSILTAESFINPNKFWGLLEDNYASLITRDLAKFRVKEFVKPFESLDPSFIIIKIPTFQTAQINEPIQNFIIKPNLTSKCFTQGQDTHLLKSLTNNFEGGLQVSKLDLGSATASENKIYKLSAKVINESTHKSDSYRSKFMRIDFYSHDGLLSTSVSNQIDVQNEWIELEAIGVSPIGATSIRIVFQVDDCSKIEESYQLKDVTLQQTNVTAILNKDDYPYFNTALQKSFIWLPPL